jgi:hypothetical protein
MDRMTTKPVNNFEDSVPTELDIVISFDTTGSMSSILWKVKTEVEKLTQNIFANSRMRGISTRLSVIAQGDYGGPILIEENPTVRRGNYTVIGIPLSDTEEPPTQFIQNIQMSVHQSREDGECYEQVLKLVHSPQMNWRPSARKSLIIIGDDSPHSPACRENVDNVNWKDELKYLENAGIKVFAIQCQTGNDERATTEFFREMGQSGAHIQLAQFNSIIEILMASLYCSTSERSQLEAHEQELIATGRYSRNLETTFNSMLQRPDAGRAAFTGSASSSSSSTPGTLTPVAPGRFQRLDVTTEATIKQFVELTGARYKAGGGYYELSKKEDISTRKNVVLEHIASGELFSGDEARRLLGLTASNTKAGVRDVPSGYRAFVQSTSFTRKLTAGSSFLWEVDPTA